MKIHSQGTVKWPGETVGKSNEVHPLYQTRSSFGCIPLRSSGNDADRRDALTCGAWQLLQWDCMRVEQQHIRRLLHESISYCQELQDDQLEQCEWEPQRQGQFSRQPWQSVCCSLLPEHQPQGCRHSVQSASEWRNHVGPLLEKRRRLQRDIRR